MNPIPDGDEGVRVPHRQLDPAALRGLIEEFVTRDGTELSDVEPKRVAVMRLLERGEVAIFFDPETSSCTIRPTETDPRE